MSQYEMITTMWSVVIIPAPATHRAVSSNPSPKPERLHTNWLFVTLQPVDACECVAPVRRDEVRDERFDGGDSGSLRRAGLSPSR